MKRIGLAFSLLLAGLVSLRAQVTVEVSQDQDQFLPGEPLQTRVRITNMSGQTLRLGAEADWLTFSVETLGGQMVPKLQEVEIGGEPLLLESAKRITLNPVDLGPAFSFAETGRYRVIATLHIHSWDQEFTSRPKSFDVIRGVEFWSRDFGVPLPAKGASGTNSLADTNSAAATNTAAATNSLSDTNSLASTPAMPEVRRYMLQKADYLKGRLRMYLRVVSGSGKTIRVTQVGPMMTFSKPDAEVDEASNLHILYQDGPQSYSYTLFNPDGQLIKRQTYDITNVRPRLARDLHGDFGVVGGIRRVTRSDVPVPPGEGDEKESSEPASASDEVKPPKS